MKYGSMLWMKFQMQINFSGFEPDLKKNCCKKSYEFKLEILILANVFLNKNI